MLTLKPLTLFLLIALGMIVGATAFWLGARAGFKQMIAGLPVEV